MTAQQLQSPDGSGAPCGSSTHLAPVLHGAAVCLVGLVLFYRPISSGLLYALAPVAVFALVLLMAMLLWLAGQLLEGRLHVRFGWPGLVFGAFMAAALVSSLLAENWFAGLRWWLAFATYGLTAFLLLQMADGEPSRRFFLSCLLASAVALAAFGLWHYVFYVPAFRRWLEVAPVFFETAVGTPGPQFADLEARVAADRAYGNFVTPNQLADFLALAFFPLAALAVGWWRARKSAAGRTRVLGIVLWGAALLLVVGVIYLTRSKGGWIAFCFGSAVFVLLVAGRSVRRHPGLALGGAGMLLLLILLGQYAGVVPGPARFARSLSVRTQYWRTSVHIALKRPALGVGPGSWGEWYTMLMAPEAEETQAAHNLYLQLWAETGTVGLLLFAAFWAVLLALVLKGPGGAAVGRTEARAPPPPADPGRAPPLTAASLCVAALALAFDYVMVGTFRPPQEVPRWLAAAPWVPYLVIYLVWAAAFVGLFACADGVAASPLACGLAAGLAAFLLHSAGEFTMCVPAIGGTVAALTALLLLSRDLPARRELRLAPGPSALVLGAFVVIVVCWSTVAVRGALDYSFGRRKAESLRSELLVESRMSPQVRRTPEFRRRAGRALHEYGRACAAVPWDDESWRELAAWLTLLARWGLADPSTSDAAKAIERAIGLNPLNAANWGMLGEARMMAGDPQSAAEAYRRAAELHPCLPGAWYRYARVAESTGRSEAASAYGQALALLPRQYHYRNRILGPPDELAEFCWTAAGSPTGAGLLEIGIQLGRRVAGLEVQENATEMEKVTRLTTGLQGRAELLKTWDSLDAEARERELWDVLAGRLWEWALRAKVSIYEASQPGGRGNSQPDGASGGT
ncbi:MAG: O-antigen ligase family protein [Candidatus Brocadiae bacterium]|nr:O-antigen ligase family protein [Candidatus Brocadiia bacterium]